MVILDTVTLRNLLATLLVGVFAWNAQKTPDTHTIKVTFDYDFAVTPACSAKVTQKCVKQFNVYEISQGIEKRTKLGSIPVPVGAVGFVKGISGATEPFLLDPGRHRLAVSAQMPDGTESDLRLCITIVQVP